MKEVFITAVDPNDTEVGKIEKMEAHRQGILHRAFSVFIFSTRGKLLMQKRALTKYHSGGLWTNTCCSHPDYGEDLKQAVNRRLKEEMRMECKLDPVFHFIYRVDLDHGLIEHELDHVFFGITDREPVPDPEEVADWKYISMDELKNEINKYPEQYTAWLKICFSSVYEKWQEIFEIK
jgi:isopentenyl-diphosphate delta-isomerase